MLSEDSSESVLGIQSGVAEEPKSLEVQKPTCDIFDLQLQPKGEKQTGKLNIEFSIVKDQSSSSSLSSAVSAKFEPEPLDLPPEFFPSQKKI